MVGEAEGNQEPEQAQPRCGGAQLLAGVCWLHGLGQLLSQDRQHFLLVEAGDDDAELGVHWGGGTSREDGIGPLTHSECAGARWYQPGRRSAARWSSAPEKKREPPGFVRPFRDRQAKP